MLNRTFAVSVATITMALTSGVFSASAADKKGDRTEALAKRLSLNDQQTTEIRKIYADYEAKMEPIAGQLWSAHREARAEMSKMLTDEQRVKLPEVIKEERSRELQPISARLGLNEEQQAKVGKTVTDFEKKFCDLAAGKNGDDRKQFIELKHEMFAAVCQDLTDDQRIRLPLVLRDEFHRMTNTQVQNDHVKVIEAKLALSGEQKTQIAKLLADCNQKSEKPIAQLTEMCQEENKAIEKVLTKEQQTTLEGIMKTTVRENK